MDNTRKHIPAWISENIITEAQGHEIEAWLDRHQPRRLSLLAVLSAVGALLVGIGIMLIIAHNWDHFPIAVRLLLALLPSVAGAALMVYTALRRAESSGWRESVSVFYVLALGASVALVSQIYQMGGSLEGFLLFWIILALPVMFVLRSLLANVLLMLLTGGFILAAGFQKSPEVPALHMVWMLSAVVIHLRLSGLRARHRFWLHIFSWLLPLSLALALGTMAVHSDHPALLLPVYTAFCGLVVWAGWYLKNAFPDIRTNGCLMLGRLGLIIISVMLSYRYFWKDVILDELFTRGLMSEPLLYVSLGFTILLLVVLARSRSGLAEMLKYAPELPLAPALVAAIFILGPFSPEAGAVVGNLLILGTGFWYLQTGVARAHLGRLNYGLLWLALFVTCRFFEFNLGYLFRGVFFIGIGLVLFGINMYIIRRKKGADHA